MFRFGGSSHRHLLASPLAEIGAVELLERGTRAAVEREFATPMKKPA